MKKRAILLLVGLVVSTQCWAIEHINLKITKEGVFKLLDAGLSFNNNGKSNAPSAQVKAGVYPVTVPLQNVGSNEIAKTIANFTSFDFNDDFKFNLVMSKITAKAKVDKSKDIYYYIENYSEKGFDFYIKLSVDNLEIRANKIDVCEKVKSGKCESALQAKFTNILIKEEDTKKIKFKTKFRVDFVNGQAQIKNKYVSVNLDDSFASTLKVDFDLYVPPIKVKVGENEGTVSMDHLRDAILSKKQKLAGDLIKYIGEYLSGDFVTMMNAYLKKVKAPTNFGQTLYSQPIEISNNEYDPYQYTTPVDNTYVYVPPVFNPVVTPSTNLNVPKQSEFDKMMASFYSMITGLSFNVSLGKIVTYKSRNIKIGLLGDLTLNYEKLKIKSTYKSGVRSTVIYLNNEESTEEEDNDPYGYNHYTVKVDNTYVYNPHVYNQPKTIGGGVHSEKKNVTAVSFDNPTKKNYDFAVSISAAILDAVLAKGAKFDLFTRLFRANVPRTSGISVDKVHLHVGKRYSDGELPRIFVIPEVTVDIGQLDVDGFWNNVGITIGGWLEGNVYFPLQFEIVPRVVNYTDGSNKIEFKIISPLKSNGDPKNEFGYYSDFDKDNIYGVVRNQFRKQLKMNVGTSTKKEYINLNDLVGRKGLTLKGVDLDVEEGGHIVLYLKMKNLDIKKLTGKK